MIKTYQLMQPLRNSSFVLRGKTNNSLRYNFSGGDPLTGKPATLMLRSQYSQDLLEQSDMFKRGYVKLVHTDKGGEVPAEKPQVTEMPDINSADKLIEFVATELDKSYRQPKAALDYAHKMGYEFPNLTIE